MVTVPGVNAAQSPEANVGVVHPANHYFVVLYISVVSCQGF